MPVSHSVPVSSSLLIEAGGHKILHTGDLRLDDEPALGTSFDANRWSRLAAGGVKALVCDSTNVFSLRKGRPEAGVGPAFAELLANTEGAMAATTFASNLARLQQLAVAARECERSVVLLGRAMERMVGVGRATGILKDFPDTISPAKAADLPRNRILLLATGSQGEPRSVISQMSFGRFRGFELMAGDTLLFSSKTIPGNERSVARVMNRYAERGVKVIGDEAQAYHVSGHANRPELAELYSITNPECVIPMHGERRHLVEHVRFAEESGHKAFLVPNGTVFDFGLMRIDGATVKTGRVYVDGMAEVAADSGVVKSRLRMARMGTACISVAAGGKANSAIRVEARLIGLATGWGRIDEDGIAAKIERDFAGRPFTKKSANGNFCKQIESTAKRIIRQSTGKTPEICVIVHQ